MCWAFQAIGEYKESEVTGTMMARDYKSPRDLITIPFTLKIRGGCEGGGGGSFDTDRQKRNTGL